MKPQTTPAALVNYLDRPNLKIQKIVTRPGSLDVLRNPSNIGGRLIHQALVFDQRGKS